MKNYESSGAANGGESKEKSSGKVEKLISGIKKVAGKIGERFGVSGDKLTEMTDDALVFVAQETIADADSDGVRTEEESERIAEAVSEVVVEGAMEEAGTVTSSGDNPIIDLRNDETTRSDLDETISTLEEERVTLPTGESVAELASDAIRRERWDHMRQTSDNLGSNPGGWFEDEVTHEEYYVKFYENQSQGRCEYIANAVYARLGIKAVRSELVIIDGKEAVASKKVPGAMRAYAEEHRTSKDVLSGFVADAFLANWDVIGLTHDNIVNSDDGMYRIDNGGALIFRAQGGDKDYVTDSIPELDSMRKRGTAGETFGQLTQEDIEAQARDLLAKLSEDDIRHIVDRSGLEGEERRRVLDGMLGRRKFLEAMCKEQSGEQ